MPRLRSGVAGADYAVAKLDKDLLDIKRALEKELTKKLREVGDVARDKVRSSHDEPFGTGALRKSIKTSVRRKNEVSLYSNLPQAGVWHWGGTITPKGAPIVIPKTEFVTKSVLENSEEIDVELANAFDSIAHRNGFF